MINVLEITRDELVGEPVSRVLILGKSITVFNIKNSRKTNDLNTGKKIEYQNESFEIMNRELVQAPVSYTKFNCVRYIIK
jgi:hypothetical protein